MSQAIRLVTKDLSAEQRVKLSRDLLTLISSDHGGDEAALGLEIELLNTTPNTRADCALALLIAASWLEAALDGNGGSRATTATVIGLAKVRGVAAHIAEGKLPKRVLEYYGGV